LAPPAAHAVTNLECYKFVGCMGGHSQSSSANPSYSNQIRINPSAVPTEKGFGIEGIMYGGEVDVSLAHGLGRVGAALSPSNSEETFFGPPGVELQQDLLVRKQQGKKYPNQKITLASAFNLLSKNGSSLGSYSLNLGVMGRYNKLVKEVLPGVGLSAIVGPFSLGTSFYQDETQLDNTYLGTIDPTVIKYQVTAYNGGISLGSLLVDYSYLQLLEPVSQATSTVRLITASLLVRKLILTASKRTEDSARDNYNYSTKQLEVQQIKEDIFGGIQVNATKNLMIGILYNYYLLHEYSLTATLFF
jgi:hypothetical protein